MGDHSNLTARRPRADAVRNRELVLEAAKSVFSAGGPDASLEAVARRAGVGIGTLYRHFPTREALFEAVYRREVEHLAELADQLQADNVAPTEALRRWLRSNVEFVATKKVMSAALALAANKSSELSAYSFARLTEAVGALLDRAHRLGIRAAFVAGDEVYGGRELRRGIRQRGMGYVMAVRANHGRLGRQSHPASHDRAGPGRPPKA